jgi:hypothetical protein
MLRIKALSTFWIEMWACSGVDLNTVKYRNIPYSYRKGSTIPWSLSQQNSDCSNCDIPDTAYTYLHILSLEQLQDNVQRVELSTEA